MALRFDYQELWALIENSYRGTADDGGRLTLASGMASYQHDLTAFLRSADGAALIAESGGTHLTDRLSVSSLLATLSALSQAMFPPTELVELEHSMPLSARAGLDVVTGAIISVILDHPIGLRIAEAMRMPRDNNRRDADRYARSGRLELRTVALQRDERGIASIEIRRPERLNVEDMQLLHDLETAADAVAMDPESLAVVLRGSIVSVGKHKGRRVFSAGIDLRKLAAGQIPLVEYMVERELGLIQKIRLGHRIDDMTVSKPWVAAVDNYAIGGGFQLALASAAVVSDPDAHFSLPALTEGFVPGVSALRLTQRIGSQRARQMILRGHIVSAKSAYKSGFLWEVAESDLLHETAANTALSLSSASATSNRMLLDLVEETTADFLRFVGSFAAEQARLMHDSGTVRSLENWQANRR